MAKQQAKKILIAEDEKLMAKALAARLAKVGFQVEMFHDGLSALECLDKEKFDLILLDVLMPRMSGIEVLNALRSRGDNTPVIILSNSIKETTMQEAKRLGVAGYFIKSNISLSEIVDAAKKYLNIQ